MLPRGTKSKRAVLDGGSRLGQLSARGGAVSLQNVGQSFLFEHGIRDRMCRLRGPICLEGTWCLLQFSHYLLCLFSWELYCSLMAVLLFKKKEKKIKKKKTRKGKGEKKFV